MASTKELLAASYLPQKEADKKLAKYGYKYDYDLSNMTNKVLTDPQGNPVILHRGSVRVSDWVSNNAPLAVGLASYAPRFKEGKKVVAAVKEKYAGRPVTSYGHSLAGSIAERSGAEKVVTLNKGAGIGDIGKTIKPSQVDIRTKYDLPSALSQFQTGGTRIELAGTVNPLDTHMVKQLPDQFFF